MKKLLTSTFRGLSAESSDIDRILDPANKSRDVIIEIKLTLFNSNLIFMRRPCVNSIFKINKIIHAKLRSFYTWNMALRSDIYIKLYCLVDFNLSVIFYQLYL